MKFEISKSSLIYSLSSVNGATERKNTIAILSNVKIEAKNGRIKFTATDMDIIITSSCEALIEKEGATTISSQLFFDIIKKVPEKNNILIELKEDNYSLSIKYGKSKFSLPSIDPNEFPILSESEMNDEFSISGKELSRIIDSVKFAIANDDTRQHINGLFLHSVKIGKNFELRSVATDTHRLAIAKSIESTISRKINGVIIPRKTINEIRRIIENIEEVKISTSKTKIKIVASDVILISKIINADFPEYERALPKENNIIINLNRKEFLSAIDRVSTISINQNRIMKFSAENNNLTLLVNTNDGSSAKEEIRIDFPNKEIETSYNPKYLFEIINQITEDKISIKLKDKISPTLIETQNNSIYIIMPVRN